MSSYFSINGTAEQQTALLKKLPYSLDEIVEKVEVAIDMFPDQLRISLLPRDTAKGVQDIYRQRYGKCCDYKAFVSLGRLEIVLSVSDASLKVLSHEIGHAIAEKYFTKEHRPPYWLHEKIAQYAEANTR